MVGRTILLLLVPLLAGCAGDVATEPTPEEAAEQQALTHRLGFADVGHETDESFAGRFEFTENDQFVGSTLRELGIDPANQRSFDISHLLPADGLYVIHVVVDADPNGGDIDVGITGDALRHAYCDCPFGGHNEVFAYGVGAGAATISIQYDEITSGPTDVSPALTGFEFTIDVAVRSLHHSIPAGVSVAVDLPVGAELELANHTSLVTLYDPDDRRIKVFEPGDDVFLSGRAGEYVFVGQEDGSPFEAVVRNASAAQARIIHNDFALGTRVVPAGTSEVLEFEVGATTIEKGGCAIAAHASVMPAMRIVTPSGETWAAAADGVGSPVGWGACFGTWLGDPDQEQGTWRVEMVQTAGDEIELIWYTTSFRR